MTEVLPKLPATRSGRAPKPKIYTTSEINRLVGSILSTDYSYLRSTVLELLYQFVILTEDTLFRLVGERVEISSNRASFSRAIARYKQDGLVENAPRDTVKKVLRAGLPEPNNGSLRAYCLGPVGEEYARRKGWNGETPLQSVTEDHLAHDLICAEAMLKMQELWPKLAASPGLAEVRGPRPVSFWDSEKRVYIVAPDGLIIKSSMEGEFVRAFLIEYHNVNTMLQVQQKLKRYEEISKPDYRWLWNDAWGLSEMPWVLILYRQGATLQHYQDEISQRDELIGKYAAASLEDVWAGKLSIVPIRKVVK